jgi:plastocyanin
MNSKSKAVTWILGIGAIVLASFIGMVGAKGSQAAGAPQSNAPKAVEIKIDNFTFGPMTLIVAAGTTVTWTNNDDVPHTVVSDDTTTFKSKALDTGDKFSYTFTKPGKYPYFCSVHPKMMAEIVVQ